MGNWYQTSFARTENGTIINTYDARSMLERGIELRGTLSHVVNGATVKFVPSDNREDYFAIVNHSESDKAGQESSESSAHMIAKEILVGSDYRFISLSGNSYMRDSIMVELETKLYGVGKDEKAFIIPDAIITTDDMVYYIEIWNKHKVTTAKFAKYKYHFNNFRGNFKVIEIDIRDIADRVSEMPYKDWYELLKLRL